MDTEAILILLFVVATAVAIAVQRLAVPYTVALVFTGLVLGLLNAFEAPHLTKALLFNVFLPGLLFEAAFHIEFKQFWRNRLTIHLLLVEKGVVIDAFHRGHVSQGIQEKLLGDIDAQLLRLESEETDESIEQKPSPDRTAANGPTES